MKWKYVKSINDSKSIENIEQKFNVKIPVDLKYIIIKYNGARPLKNIFDTQNSKERVFKSLLSYNKEDKENIYIYDELFHRGYIPFAITPSGDLLCINKENQNVELYLHETDIFELICSDITKFIDTLYII